MRPWGPLSLGHELECSWRPECQWLSFLYQPGAGRHGDLPLPEPGLLASNHLGSAVCVRLLQQPGSQDSGSEWSFRWFCRTSHPLHSVSGSLSLFCMEWSRRLALTCSPRRGSPLWFPRPCLSVGLVLYFSPKPAPECHSLVSNSLLTCRRPAGDPVTL